MQKCSCSHLSLTDTDGNPNTPEAAEKAAKAALEGSGLPLLVYGPGQADVDNDLLVPVANACAGRTHRHRPLRR